MIITMKLFAYILGIISLLPKGGFAFSISLQSGSHKRLSALSALLREGDEVSSSPRRSLFSSALALSLVATSGMRPALADTGAEVRGIGLTPFNSLIFQYRGSEFGGLKASDLDEPSIPYADFITRLRAGEVEFVEFLAPDGDAAYVTFKAKEGQGQQSPIRIGEGYPIEQHDGWSSPVFAVRAVKNAGVPYKFTVPALRAYNK